MKFFRSACALCATLLVLSGAAFAQGFSLRDGDRVVFYGDSITEQRQYTTFVETYVVTRFPQLKVNFVHSGWSADKVTGGQGGPIDLRLQRDVIAYKPTVLTIMLGMNDGYYRPFDQGIFDTYASGYEHIIDVVRRALPDVRITAIQPSPYDDVTRAPTFDEGYNAVLIHYSQFLSDLAHNQNLGLADFNTPVVAMLQKAKLDDPALSSKIIPDRVHPGPGGHIVMAAALLASWNAPALVTAVEINSIEGRVVRADNTKISDWKTGFTLSWTQTDNALPMPIDRRDQIMALALRSSGVTEALNQQPLVITGLALPKYELRIDGTSVGVFTKEQLAAGINLATLPTPMMAQAANVHALTLQHNNVHFTRWRQLQVPLQTDTFPAVQQAVQTSLPALLAALDAEEADLVVRQRAAAQPVPRRYELIAQAVERPEPF